MSRPRDGRPGLGITKSVVLGRRNANSILVAAKVGETGKASEKWGWLKTFQSNLTFGSTDPDVPDVSDLTEPEKDAIEAVLKLSRPSSEAERMMKVLNGIASGFDAMKNLGVVDEDEDDDDNGGGAAPPPPDASRVAELLLILRDVVGERVDYAKAFVAVGGLSVLLGGASERLLVPRNVRSTCLRVLADLVKKNPTVQYTLLDHSGIRALAAIYFAELSQAGINDESDGLIRGRVVKIMSAAVVGHHAAEHMFCTSPEARKVIESGMGMHEADEPLPAPPAALRRQCVAFLEDLLVIHGSAPKDYESRVKGFKPALDFLANMMLAEETEPDWEVRESAIKTLRGVLRQSRGDEAVLEMKETIAAKGEKRMGQMKALDRTESNASDVERVDEELYLWGQLSEELEKSS